MSQITGNAVLVRTLFNNRYTVQYYQREYNWERKQIEELIDDLTSAFLEMYQTGDTQKEVRGYEKYFLGPIILTTDNAIIDGQQRLSSLTLLMIYLNNLQKSSPGVRVNIDNLIYSEMYGQKTFCINVDEREPLLESLFDELSYDIERETSESVINMFRRYKDIEEIFPEDLKGEGLPVFIEWVVDNITFIEIRTDSEQDAHKVFVTMNDRGLRLTSTDMLKGYLLSEIRDNDTRNHANDFWKERALELKQIEKDGDVDFFKNWLRAQYAESIRDRTKGSQNQDFDIIGTTFHKWVRENRVMLGLNKSADFERFVLKQFDVFSTLYLNLKKWSGSFTAEYEYVYYNADRGFTLQDQIIMAAVDAGDSSEVVARKVKVVSAFIDQFIARRVFNFKTVDYSSIKNAVFNITKMIRRNSISDVVSVLTQFLGAMDQSLEGIDDFYLNQFTGRYMRHILARMTYFVGQKCGKNYRFSDYVDRDQTNPYDIEHIWADDYTQGHHANDFQTEEEFRAFRNRFGGLLILPHDKNRSFQDMSYEEKVEKYDTDNLLAWSLSADCYRNNPSFIRFVENSHLPFKAYGHFDKQQFQERQQLYKELCAQIWNPDELAALANP